jgi:hypothetical protein
MFSHFCLIKNPVGWSFNDNSDLVGSKFLNVEQVPQVVLEIQGPTCGVDPALRNTAVDFLPHRPTLPSFSSDEMQIASGNCSFQSSHQG